VAAAVTVKEIEYGPWGHCVQVSNGIVDVVATLDFGPRLIRFGFTGGDNLFLEDTEQKVVSSGERFAPVGGGSWHIYGGHRLWSGPEAEPRTTYPDNEPVVWEALSDGIVLTPPQEQWTQLQKQMEVRLDAATSTVTVVHRITNTGPWAVTFAPWALSVMAPGGKAIVPQVQRETGLLANRIISVWSYAKMNDPRIAWGERFITLQQDRTLPPFKIGTNNEEGWAAYHNGDNLFVKRYEHLQEGTYPDNGVSFETYTNELFLELETLGELKPVAPGETVKHTETWELYKADSLPYADETELSRVLREITGR